MERQDLVQALGDLSPQEAGRVLGWAFGGHAAPILEAASAALEDWNHHAYSARVDEILGSGDYPGHWRDAAPVALPDGVDELLGRGRVSGFSVELRLPFDHAGLAHDVLRRLKAKRNPTHHQSDLFDLGAFNWHLFRKQRLFLGEALALLEKTKPDAAHALMGLENWLEDVAEAGEKAGYRVPFLVSPDEPCGACNDTGEVPAEPGGNTEGDSRALGDGRQWCLCRMEVLHA